MTPVFFLTLYQCHSYLPDILKSIIPSIYFPDRIKSFGKDRLIATVLIDFALLLLFGIASPPAAAALGLKILSELLQSYVLISRCVLYHSEVRNNRSEASDDGAAARTENDDCTGYEYNISSIDQKRLHSKEEGFTDTIASSTSREMAQTASENNDSDLRLKRDQAYAVLEENLKDGPDCIVSAIWVVLLITPIPFGLFLLEMAADRAPINDLVWIPTVIMLIPVVTYIYFLSIRRKLAEILRERVRRLTGDVELLSIVRRISNRVSLLHRASSSSRQPSSLFPSPNNENNSSSLPPDVGVNENVDLKADNGMSGGAAATTVFNPSGVSAPNH